MFASSVSNNFELAYYVNVITLIFSFKCILDVLVRQLLLYTVYFCYISFINSQVYTCNARTLKLVYRKIWTTETNDIEAIKIEELTQIIVHPTASTKNSR